MIDFQTAPDRYRHWRLTVEPPIAWLTMDVAEDQGLRPGYTLKLNSYDLGVDIELYDAVQRLRFEHPDVGAVILTSGKERMFCAGANIRMLGQSDHAHKVNFCKFTNETRCAIESAGTESDQHYIGVINGPASGGGYELALACDWVILVDDGASAVSLPEVPLLAVLPGTGGLTRLVDKRKVRRDRADFFCTTAEGLRGQRALDWGLVDELIKPSALQDGARARAQTLAGTTNSGRIGITLDPLARTVTDDLLRYPFLEVALDRGAGIATFRIDGPDPAPPADAAGLHAQGADCWPLALARSLDDAILTLRSNHPDIGTWVITTSGDAGQVAAYDDFLLGHEGDWLAREIRDYWKRVLKRLDLSARSLIAVIGPGSCFVGTLLELSLAADRSYMLDGPMNDQLPPIIRMTAMNAGRLPMATGLSRLHTRFINDADGLAAAEAVIGQDLDAAAADAAGLVTFTPDDIDWDDEVRLAIEERASFSPDALTGMEANLRFPGPETLESKIFGRLSAWQNWIFQRPNAAGDQGALKLYGTGQRAKFDKTRT